MSTPIPTTRFNRLLFRLAAFFNSGRFPIFVILVLLFYQAFLAVMVFAPPVGSTWVAFA